MGITRTGTTPGKYTICTSSTRPSSPAVGDKLYETDTGYELTYQGATDTWTPNWRTAWGVAVDTTWTTATSTTSSSFADVTNATLTVPFLANRKYKHTISFAYVSGVANDTLEWAITDSGGTAKGVITVIAKSQIVANVTESYTLVIEETGAAGGSATRKLRHKRVAGSGTCQTYADASQVASWIVEDIGPTGAPS